MTDAERLADIRHGLAAVSPGRWHMMHDGQAYVVMAESEMAGQRVELCRMGPLASDSERAFLADAPAAVAFLLGLVDRAAARVRALTGTAPEKPSAEERRRADQASYYHQQPGKDYAAQAAMLCASAGFRAFLVERKGLAAATEDGAAARVRTLCGVVSRREINADQRAQKAWRALLGDYETWRRAG